MTMPRIWHDVNIPSSTVPADGPLPPLLLGFLGAEVAEDPPVGEAEGVGHGVADVGPAEHRQRDADDGVEDGHHLRHRRLGRDVAVSCGGGGEKKELRL